MMDFMEGMKTRGLELYARKMYGAMKIQHAINIYGAMNIHGMQIYGIYGIMKNKGVMNFQRINFALYVH